jgi:F0F1-type ATP synthase assembly protein I
MNYWGDKEKMNDILLKIQTFFFKENISKAKKRCLFLVAFVVMAIVEYISLIAANLPPEYIKTIIPLTVATALFAGVMTVFIPRLIGLFGLKNLYSSAVIMAAISSILANPANPDGFTTMEVITGFTATVLPLMLVMWLAILLSKKQK